MPSTLMNQAPQAGRAGIHFLSMGHAIPAQAIPCPHSSAPIRKGVPSGYCLLQELVNKGEQICIGALGVLTLVLPVVELHKLFSLLKDIELISWRLFQIFKQLKNMKFPKAMGRYPQSQQQAPGLGAGGGNLTSPSPSSKRACFGPRTETEDKNLCLLHHTYSSPSSTASCGQLFPCCQAQHCCKEHKTVWESLGFARWQKANRDCVTFVYSLINFTLALVICPKKFSVEVENTVPPFQTQGHLNALNQAGIWCLKTPVKGSF